MSTMDRKMDRILNDRLSGSLQIAVDALEVIERHVAEGNEAHARDFLDSLNATYGEMAVILRMNRWFKDNDLKSDSVTGFRKILEDQSHILAAKKLFPYPKSILTFSNSGSVTDLLEAYRDNITQLYCGRSLPGGEGEVLSERARRLGIPVLTIEDMEISRHILGVDLVLIGADTVTPDFIVNKIGTLQLALLCRYFDKPLYCVANRVKYLSREDGHRLLPNTIFEKVDRSLVIPLELMQKPLDEDLCR